MKETEQRWTKSAAELLTGQVIASVRYMSDEEAEDMGWDSRPLVIRLSNGLQIYASRDDEGNDGGALFTTDSDLDCIPVISLGA